MSFIRCCACLAVLLGGCAGSDDRPWPADGDGPEGAVTQVTTGRAGDDKDPEVSADGKLLFYASSSHGDNFDLFVRALGSSTATRLTSRPGDERFPKLNPTNPRMLAFCSDARGEWDIYLMPDWVASPSKVVVVSEAGADDIHPSWSPDGTHLVYCSSDASGEWGLRIKDWASGETRILEDVDGLLPEWSPRGNRIVFQRMKRRDGWLGSLWTLEYSEGTAKNLTAVFGDDDWAAINPSWTPDGARIVFATVGKSPGRTGVAHEGDDIWIVDADGAHPTRLTTSPAADGMPVFAPGGRLYFVSRRSGTDRIWSLQVSSPKS